MSFDKDLLNEKWDKEIQEMIQKSHFFTEPIVVPDEIKFPFLMVFYRKKVTSRNTNYLLAAPIMGITDIAVQRRSIKHHGWPIMTLMFDLPEWMIPDETATRYEYWKFDNWNHIKKHLSKTDQLLIPDLEIMFPCP